MLTRTLVRGRIQLEVNLVDAADEPNCQVCAVRLTLKSLGETCGQPHLKQVCRAVI